MDDNASLDYCASRIALLHKTCWKTEDSHITANLKFAESPELQKAKRPKHLIFFIISSSLALEVRLGFDYTSGHYLVCFWVWCERKKAYSFCCCFLAPHDRDFYLGLYIATKHHLAPTLIYHERFPFACFVIFLLSIAICCKCRYASDKNLHPWCLVFNDVKHQ